MNFFIIMIIITLLQLHKKCFNHSGAFQRSSDDASRVSRLLDGIRPSSQRCTPLKIRSPKPHMVSIHVIGCDFCLCRVVPGHNVLNLQDVKIFLFTYHELLD